MDGVSCGEGLRCEEVAAADDGGDADAPDVFVGCSLSKTRPRSMRMIAISHICQAGRKKATGRSDSRREEEELKL